MESGRQSVAEEQDEALAPPPPPPPICVAKGGSHKLAPRRCGFERIRFVFSAAGNSTSIPSWLVKADLPTAFLAGASVIPGGAVMQTFPSATRRPRLQQHEAPLPQVAEVLTMGKVEGGRGQHLNGACMSDHDIFNILENEKSSHHAILYQGQQSSLVTYAETGTSAALCRGNETGERLSFRDSARSEGGEGCARPIEPDRSVVGEANFSLHSAKPRSKFCVPESAPKLGSGINFSVARPRWRETGSSGEGKGGDRRESLCLSTGVCSPPHEAVMCSGKHTPMLHSRIKGAMENAVGRSWITQWRLKKRRGWAWCQGRQREANPPVTANLKASLDMRPADPARRLRSPPTGEMSWVISGYSAIPPEQRPSGQFLPFRADDRTLRDVH
ncbi:hypothetical protein E2C01_043952 [Portunus trituberculatus]|uniref:Uncharacterized protein n=1 Tax=Portunus trituberculatus TaxID=210409 RepID=A0A5B7FQS5_PORTR|nr:hypothetical protein [Portunus trituberculatus]